MPNSLQYPLELRRDLQRRWGRLLQRTAVPKPGPLNEHLKCPVPLNASLSCNGSASRIVLDPTAMLGNTIPPRNPDNGDDEEDEEDDNDDNDEDDERDPAVIREPDEDE